MRPTSDGLHGSHGKPLGAAFWRVLALIILAAVAATLAIPWLRTRASKEGADAFASVRRSVSPRLEELRPSGAMATSSGPGHDPAQAWDLDRSTYWSEGAEGDGIGQAIAFLFDAPVELDAIVVVPGAPGGVEAFTSQPRPRELHIAFDDGTGIDVTLRDDPRPQTISLERTKRVGRVEVTISSVYKSATGSDTSITEVEFRKKA